MGRLQPGPGSEARGGLWGSPSLLPPPAPGTWATDGPGCLRGDLLSSSAAVTLLLAEHMPRALPSASSPKAGGRAWPLPSWQHMGVPQKHGASREPQRRPGPLFQPRVAFSCTAVPHALDGPLATHPHRSSPGMGCCGAEQQRSPEDWGWRTGLEGLLSCSVGH